MEVVAVREQAPTGWGPALGACRKPANLRRTAAISIVVGMVFTLINELGPLVQGHGTWVTGVKVAVNYLVPFVVANLGVLTAARNRS